MNSDSVRALSSVDELSIADEVWSKRDLFIRWPSQRLLLLEGVVREKYHKYPIEIAERLKQAGIPRDGRSNGPAIAAYRLAGGQRPMRNGSSREWSVHHIYDGKFPALGRDMTTHAVRDGRYFTEAAGLVAVHPVADALADEVPYFAWLLRVEANRRFEFDPDQVF